MTDYSQSQEQAAILAAFEGRAPGRFLDIGAYHPTQFSNTRALYDLGWGGLMIEPSPGPLAALVREYGNSDRVQVMSAAVGIAPGFVALHVSDDAVSTGSAETYATWQKDGGYYGMLFVPIITLEQIANQFGGHDFWNIDAEGMSADIFQQMLKLRMRPRCVCVEFDNRLPELCEAATQCGYRLTMSNGTNAVFVR